MQVMVNVSLGLVTSSVGSMLFGQVHCMWVGPHRDHRLCGWCGLAVSLYRVLGVVGLAIN